ncbi:MAG TPA: hypothetical protein VHA75_21220, partial [Rugosimonospora sp.]|nr:hypothetical protein [Rugosimonospora sp.]
SSTGVTTGEPTSSGAVGGSTLATTVLPPARLAPQPVSATVSTTVAPVLTPAVREEPPAPTTSEAPPPARSGTTADLTAPSAVVVQGHLSSPRGSSTGSSLDHLRTLSGSSRRSATAPPDPRRLVEDWLAAGDWPASMEFFAAYRTALHTPQAREALGRLVEAGAGRAAVLAALLDERFAGHGEIGYRYLIAATPDEGLDVVLPELVEQPDLIEAMAALIEAVDGGQRQLDYHAVMLRATGLALAGRAEEAVRLVRGVRGRIPGKPKLAWVDRLKNAGGGDQPAVAAVGQVREELMLCGIPSKS